MPRPRHDDDAPAVLTNSGYTRYSKPRSTRPADEPPFTEEGLQTLKKPQLCTLLYRTWQVPYKESRKTPKQVMINLVLELQEREGV